MCNVQLVTFITTIVEVVNIALSLLLESDYKAHHWKPKKIAVFYTIHYI